MTIATPSSWMKSRTLADDDSHLPFLLWPQSNAPPRAPLRNWPELGLYPVGSLLVTAALHPCPHNPPLFHLFLGAPQSQLQEPFSRSSCNMTPRHGTVTRLPQAITRLTLGRKPGDVSPGVPCRDGRPGGPTGGRVCTDGVRRVSAPEQKQPADRTSLPQLCRLCRHQTPCAANSNICRRQNRLYRENYSLNRKST